MPRTWRAYVCWQTTMSWWGGTAPLGKPVEPEEYIQKAASSREVGAASSRAEALPTRSSQAWYWPAGPPATRTWRRLGDWPSAGPTYGTRAGETTAPVARLSRRK